MSKMIWAAVLLSLVLAGCSTNNNGTGTSAGTTPGDAQGFYPGTDANGDIFDTIVLPDDSMFAVYGTAGAAYVCGMISGQGGSSAGSYAANVVDFDQCGGSLLAYSGSITASYVPGSSLTGTLAENGFTEDFSGSVPTSFNYNTPASLSAISGTWTGTLLDGSTATVNISSNGSLTGSDSGCSFSGTITPDTSNRNFFDVSLTFGPSPCAFANQTGTGIAVDYLLSDGVTTQLIAPINVGSAATVFASQR
jgi:hypothetical protein